MGIHAALFQLSFFFGMEKKRWQHSRGCHLKVDGDIIKY